MYNKYRLRKDRYRLREIYKDTEIEIERERE